MPPINFSNEQLQQIATAYESGQLDDNDLQNIAAMQNPVEEPQGIAPMNNKWVEAATRSALPFADELDAANKGVVSLIRGDGFSSGYDAQLADLEARKAQAVEENPYAYYGTQAAGMIAPGVALRGLKAINGIKKLSDVSKFGGLVEAITGAGNTEGKLSNIIRQEAAANSLAGAAYGASENKDDRASGALSGSLFGGAIGGAVPIIGKGISAASESAKDLARIFTSKGSKAIEDQILRETLTPSEIQGIVSSQVGNTTRLPQTAAEAFQNPELSKLQDALSSSLAPRPLQEFAENRMGKRMDVLTSGNPNRPMPLDTLKESLQLDRVQKAKQIGSIFDDIRATEGEKVLPTDKLNSIIKSERQGFQNVQTQFDSTLEKVMDDITANVSKDGKGEMFVADLMGTKQDLGEVMRNGSTSSKKVAMQLNDAIDDAVRAGSKDGTLSAGTARTYESARKDWRDMLMTYDKSNVGKIKKDVVGYRGADKDAVAQLSFDNIEQSREIAKAVANNPEAKSALATILMNDIEKKFANPTSPDAVRMASYSKFMDNKNKGELVRVLLPSKATDYRDLARNIADETSVKELAKAASSRGTQTAQRLSQISNIAGKMGSNYADRGIGAVIGAIGGTSAGPIGAGIGALTGAVAGKTLSGVVESNAKQIANSLMTKLVDPPALQAYLKTLSPAAQQYALGLLGQLTSRVSTREFVQ